MARPSKLTEKQWNEIQRRLMNGDTPGMVAKDFGVGRTTITDRFPAGCRELKELANQIVSTDAQFKALPIASQVSVMSLVDDLKAISMHLAGAAKFGSATAHRLAGIANAQVDKIDDADLMASHAILQSVSALTKIANDAAVPGFNLLNANKESIKIINNAPHAPSRTLDTSKLSSSALRELLDARA